MPTTASSRSMPNCRRRGRASLRPATASSRRGSREAMVVEAAEQGKTSRPQHRRLSALGSSSLMVDLRSNLAGIKSPNPFWLASAPPTNSGYQVMRAFEAGWGGAVWKTLGEPIVNVTSRFAALNYSRTKHDRPQQHRADHRPPARRESARDSRVQEGAYPERAIVALADDRSRAPEAWHELVNAVQDAGCRRLRAQLRLPARDVASAAWARPSARIPSWSR